MITTAIELASKYHSSQVYGKYPYMYHLFHVASLVAPYGESYEVNAILHDIVEDTNVDEDILLLQFGKDMVDAIKLCSYNMSIKNKGERTLEFYDRWKAINKGVYYNVDTVIATANTVKVADRLSNINHCIWWNDQTKLNYYLEEMTFFRESLYIPGNAMRLWLQLDDLMMKYG